ncbi:AraC family transcriptional regulator (plasmid) [Bartonella sp. HY329]|uniref:AraC family transcriptional regulator n=1 Tax=unclassified Bartonella TaxID=2645622 RepID=UPI0021CAAC48|nr:MULTISPECIES: AraC family transcriptional regulator [unclassified Bartonella]UXM96481.1 AraC family transcriptional regulator [Bartonella sp. HY329]UXN10804.1 AraC family transcriptional regulator [Bartonella sp. HY328]
MDTPYKDIDLPNCDSIIMVDDIVARHENCDPSVDFSNSGDFEGRYRGKLLTPNIQYFDCDLTTTKPFQAAMDLKPGLFIGQTIKGNWVSYAEDQPIIMDNTNELTLCGCGKICQHHERQEIGQHVKMTSFYINADFFEQIAKDEPIPDELLKLIAGNAPCLSNLPLTKTMQTILEQIYASPLNGYVTQIEVTGLALALIAECITALSAQPIKSNFNRRHHELAYEVKSYLDEHLNQRHLIGDIASRFATNESTLRRAFKSTFGVSITTYLRGKLLEMARMQVRLNQLHIAEIAYQCGFSDPANFTNAYRNHFGHAPTVDRFK